MKKKKYIKCYRSKSSLTGEVLKSGFYVLHISKYGHRNGIGYCKGPEHNYEMDFERSKSLFVNIYDCFIPECNAKTHEERVKLLEKNAFLNFATRGVPRINSEENCDKLNKHRNFFDKNNSLIFFGDFCYSKSNKDNDNKIKYNNTILNSIYSFNYDEAWKDVKYNKNFFFVEESIFDHFTSEFDALFKNKCTLNFNPRSDNTELCIENICTYQGIQCRKKLSNRPEFPGTIYCYPAETTLVSFFKSKLLDKEMTLSRKKPSFDKIEKRYKYEVEFNNYLKSNSLI